MSFKKYIFAVEILIRLFVAELSRFQVGQNPIHFSRVCPPAKMASLNTSNQCLKKNNSLQVVSLQYVMTCHEALANNKPISDMFK